MLVCQGRAVADGRMAEGRFADPTAMALLREDENPWAHEAVRSSWTPAAMADLLRRHGFAVHRDDDLLSLARALPIPVHQRRSLQAGRVAVADR